MTYHDPQNARVEGAYGAKSGNVYGGYVSRQNGAVDIGGCFSTSGPLPGTRANFKGDVAVRGRDTVVSGGATITDPTCPIRGRERLDRPPGV